MKKVRLLTEAIKADQAWIESMQLIVIVSGTVEVSAVPRHSTIITWDRAAGSTPGSAPFLTASAMAANIQSQTMMQKLLAAMLRQESARVAHENAVRKRYGILVTKVRQSVSDILSRP